MPQILKIWHKWSWLYHILVTVVFGTVLVVGYGNATADNTRQIVDIRKQHDQENMATRMAVQENAVQEVNRRLGNIETVQGKIFDRINQIADREPHGR